MGSWRKAGWDPGLRASLAAPNSAFSMGQWVPSTLAVGQEGKGLHCLMKNPGLMGALAGHLRSCSEKQMQTKAKVIVLNTFLASFQASLGTTHGLLASWPRLYVSNQSGLLPCLEAA